MQMKNIVTGETVTTNEREIKFKVVLLVVTYFTTYPATPTKTLTFSTSRRRTTLN